VTTLAGLPQYADEKGNAALRRTADALNTANLTLLRQSGVSIAIGSDEYSDTSVREAVYLNELRVFDSAELLRIWTQTTPRAIFPGRRIGTLAPGYESSFLSLSGDPLADFSNIKRIRLRVKQGREIPIPP
jgi:imidazolonepropionase-like amidohydrolase